MLDQIPEQPWGSLSVVLIFRIRHTSNLSDALFRIICYPDKLALRRAGRSHQWLWFGQADHRSMV